MTTETESQAVLAGTHTADVERASGSTQEIQAFTVDSMQSSVRIAEATNHSVQPLTITWQGSLLTNPVAAHEPQPLIRIVAKAGSLQQVYLFDALPGGEWVVVASSVTVDICFDVQPQWVENNSNETAWLQPWNGRMGGVTTGLYRVSAFVREGRGHSRGRLTNFVVRGQLGGVDIIRTIVRAPSWARGVFISVPPPGAEAAGTTAEQLRGVSAESLTFAYGNIVVYTAANLDTYGSAGVVLPVLGDSIMVSTTPLSTSLIWYSE